MDDKDFIEEMGTAFLAHRLKRASEALVDDISALLVSRGLAIPGRGASTVLLLHRDGPMGITEIAQRLRLSHPLIIRMTNKLVDAELATTSSDPNDMRRSVVALTRQGHEQALRLEACNKDIERAISAVFDEIGLDMLAGLTRLESALRTRPISARAAEEGAAQTER
ncbi:MarR family winged helix-turn-helix transcriptional regulator [Sphingomonas sp. LaA6.9]|uniref:MarR family winged helix-turn-helix transcriptional regulator n=1 Tax=Sphingomonas sp. LaA6.9 TaxID=2919914 RepID=UPI001F4F9330|nr:MarR family transcriptional regulator [Sphingomonas sp. LaA6.9]MCJ8157301.1 MarR family transcriptional regulator [Sphingomonas sp. LaA6.9]